MKEKLTEKFGAAEIISEHRGQWKKIWMLAVNDLVKKYKGAVMGPLWALIKPSFTLFILWFAFSVGIKHSGMVSGYPRFVFMLSGYIPWFFISEEIIGGSRSIRVNSQFVTKLSFPVSNIMTFTALSSLIIHTGMCVIMYVVLLCMGYGPSVYNLQIFYYMPMMFLFFLVLSWATAPLSGFSKDFENLINSIMTGLFWLSGIFWDTYDVSNKYLKTLMYFNPINYFINGYRKSFLYETFIFDSNYTTETIIFFAEFILLILVGSHYYKKLRKILPDVL
ncbi:MAG: ABC transporter permease [Oscillospiraceae bacterium]|nr:ABC transporter permease [Oscillospiraceae bacterium]